ncbi:hypothetical protein [Amorphus sp. 3PC139-8]|uniref:hypothetical protein n=1 Tax=Amorphus sp. 3PC139-8 TaxID=2735676 RepID=UPI00345CB6B9
MPSTPDEIQDALWAAAPRDTSYGRRSDAAGPSRNAIALTRRSLMAFLDEIEADTTVGEIREALEA